ncbi:MAG: C4-dicarboxylic acid transporter DauA [Deltaproteobacteria bacterium]|nr:C4-dicarboxylic acid transporter DauA [Deltaproteobacteria bacterium]
MPPSPSAPPASSPAINRWPIPLASALRESLREGYSPARFRADILAGLVVGMVALPLSMALAIASGASPQSGLYTAILAGSVVALLGGSRFQITGPTAAFVVILAPITQQYGFSGLLVAGMMAGGMLLGMGLARMGRLIEYIPYPVTTGFTSGIALVIGILQLKDFLGLSPGPLPPETLAKVWVMVGALPTANEREMLTGGLTLGLLWAWGRWIPRLPAPLAVLALVTAGSMAAASLWPEWQVATIDSRFHWEVNGITGNGIPPYPPHFLLPWELPGPGGVPLGMSLDVVRMLLGPAFAIAILGAVESLVTAVAADGMGGTRHDPDAELTALGIGNLLVPFFGGVAATGAISRTATNLRFGGRTPVAAITQSLFQLGAMLLFAPLVAHVPMAALAALVLMVSIHMFEARQFFYLLRVSPRSDMLVLLTCFGLTVSFDMVVGVTAGVVLAALLFIRRMADVTQAGLVGTAAHPKDLPPIPEGVLVYYIAGPLFFGAARRAMDAMTDIHAEIRRAVFVLEDVPVMDMTGLVAFQGVAAKLNSKGVAVVLVGVKPQPRGLMERAGLLGNNDRVTLADSLHQALLETTSRK